MFLNEVNKEDLRRRNREMRSKIIARQREQILKDKKQKEIQYQKELEQKELFYKKYPEFILTILKRLKRIDPWNGVANIDHKISCIVSYFKLKQLSFKNLRILTNSIHSWVEFEYNDSMWIFDPIAVRNRNLGLPIKRKNDGDVIEYKTLSKSYTNINTYYEDNESDMYLSIDELKILAMKDIGLQLLNKINYH